MSSTSLLERPLPVPATGQRRLDMLAVLGDSTAVGLGDRVAGNMWRGFARLLAEAMGTTTGASYVNAAQVGATVASVRRDQLPVVVARAPRAAVVVVGMNDTLRADFDPGRIREDFVAIAEALDAGGCLMVTVRYHDHTCIVRLPGPLRRALQHRIRALNAAIDHIADLPNVVCVDLTPLHVDDAELWSVDRLHPSEVGHRHLARAFAAALGRAGFEIVAPVTVRCSGGVAPTSLDRAWWMITEGIPWLGRRGRDLLPAAATVMVRAALHRVPARSAR